MGQIPVRSQRTCWENLNLWKVENSGRMESVFGLERKSRGNIHPVSVHWILDYSTWVFSEWVLRCFFPASVTSLGWKTTLRPPSQDEDPAVAVTTHPDPSPLLETTIVEPALVTPTGTSEHHTDPGTKTETKEERVERPGGSVRHLADC